MVIELISALLFSRGNVKAKFGLMKTGMASVKSLFIYCLPWDLDSVLRL